MPDLSLQRLILFDRLHASLRENRVTALIGPRQCGKTWLSRQMATHYFDAQNPIDQARLANNPLSILSGLEGIVVIDEAQDIPDLFPVLRVLADDPAPRRTFLLTGSASPDLMGHVAEALAGRVRFLEMGGFHLAETGDAQFRRLWLRGGFPLAFLARNDLASAEWRGDFVKSYLQRDLRTLAETRLSPFQLSRFLGMLAHCHGQMRHQAELAKSLALDVRTIRRHLDIFTGAYLLRQLPAFEENVGKRIQKTPKTYFRDSGILHSLLRIQTPDDLDTNPALGASWEGFCIEQITRLLSLPEEDCYYWRTQAGAELDFLVLRGRRRFGFEFKTSDRPSTSKAMHVAIADLKLERLFVIHPGARTFMLHDKIEALSIGDLQQISDKLLGAQL